MLSCNQLFQPSLSEQCTAFVYLALRNVTNERSWKACRDKSNTKIIYILHLTS